MESTTTAKENTMEKYRNSFDALPRSNIRLATDTVVDFTLQDMADQIDKLAVQTAADARRMADKYLRLATDIEERLNGEDPAGSSLARDLTAQTEQLRLRKDLFRQTLRMTKGKDLYDQFIENIRK